MSDGRRARRQLLTGDEYAGVSVVYNPGPATLSLSGWYDTHTGIAPEAVALATFLRTLGITVKDCEAALGEGAA